MERIDGVGAALYHLLGEAHRRAVVAAYVFDTRDTNCVPSTEDELADYLLRRMGDHPLVHRALVPTPLNLDNPVLVDTPDTPPRARVSTRKVGGTGSWADTLNTLVAVASETTACAVPFEVIVLDGVDAQPELPPGVLVVVLRTDHAVMDGTARAALERRFFTSEAADWRAQPPAAPYVPGRTPSAGRVLLSAALSLPGRVRTTARLAGQARRIAKDQPARRANDLAGTSPRTAIDNTGDTDARVYEFFTVPLATIRAARTAVDGATVNDVVLAAIATALRGYLTENDELPAQPLRCFIPIAVPSARGRTGGNSITRGLIPLWTTVADTRERLRSTSEATAAVKKEVAAGPQVLAEQAVLTLFAPAAALRRRRGAGEHGANVAVTNVSRGPKPLYLDDARAVRTHVVSVLNAGAPLAHQVTNLEDTLMVSLSGGASALLHPRRYRELLEGAFAELAALGPQDPPTG